jgi:hypothetical protein
LSDGGHNDGDVPRPLTCQAPPLSMAQDALETTVQKNRIPHVETPLQLHPSPRTLEFIFVDVGSNFGCRNPTLKVCEEETHTLEIGTCESFGTPKTSKFDCRGQNTSHWSVSYIIGKLSKFRCWKWARMGHLDIYNTSYGKKKGRESVKLAVWLPTTKSWELTRPQCVQVECDTPLESSRGELQVCFRPHSIGDLNKELWPRKIPGVQIGIISGSPGTKIHSDVGAIERHRVYYMEEGGGFLRVRAVVNQVNPELPVACPSTKGVTTLLRGKCEDETHTLENGTWESSGTFETSKVDCKGQNTLHWGVLYIIEKLLKCRCRKWPHIGHLDIYNTSYGKSRKSTRPRCMQVKCDTLLESSWGELRLCFRLHPNRRSEQRVMIVQNLGSPNRDSFGTPPWES